MFKFKYTLTVHLIEFKMSSQSDRLKFKTRRWITYGFLVNIARKTIGIFYERKNISVCIRLNNIVNLHSITIFLPNTVSFPKQVTNRIAYL